MKMNDLILVLLSLLSIVGIGLAAFYASRRKARHCPHCGISGQALSFGRFECICCHHQFLLRSRGASARSLGRVLFFPLLISFSIQATILAFWLHDRRGVDLVFLGLIAAQQVYGYWQVLTVKRFPAGTAEPDAPANGGPVTPLGNSGVTEGPPSVS